MSIEPTHSGAFVTCSTDRRPADSNHSAGAIHPQTRSRAWFGNSQIDLEIFYFGCCNRGGGGLCKKKEEQTCQLMTTDPKECPIKQAGVGSTLPSPPAAPASPRAPAGDGEREVAEEDSSDLFFVAVAAWRSGVKGQCRQSIVRIAAVVAPFEGGEGKKRCAMWGNSGQIIVDVSPCLCFRRLKNPRYGTSPAKNKRRVIILLSFPCGFVPSLSWQILVVFQHTKTF
jgi:hypothetical protein